MDSPEFDALRERIDEGFGAMDARFVAIDGRFRAVETRLAGIEKKLEEGFSDMHHALSILLRPEEVPTALRPKAKQDRLSDSREARDR